jgi:hypothetical protein
MPLRGPLWALGQAYRWLQLTVCDLQDGALLTFWAGETSDWMSGTPPQTLPAKAMMPTKRRLDT